MVFRTILSGARRAPADRLDHRHELEGRGEPLAVFLLQRRVGYCPHMVAFSSGGRRTPSFIEETGEFVCNFATFDLREAVNATSAPLPRGEGWPMPATALASREAAAVAEAPLECKWVKTVPLEPLEGGRALSFGHRPGRRRAYRRSLHRRWDCRYGRDAPDHARRLSRLLHPRFRKGFSMRRPKG